MKNNWYVITGGPCSGKSTTINLLRKNGYLVTTETARAYYQSQIDSGISNEELRQNPQKLQDEISKRQIELESTLDPDKLIFLDRALPDSIAYYKFLDITIPDVIQKKYEQSNYKRIFFMEELPYKNDGIRSESQEEARKISDLVFEVYRHLGVSVTRVPMASKKKRIEFILKYIDNS